MGVDFREFKKFVNDWKITETEFEPFLKRFLAEQAHRLIAKTAERTPVDTGALRARWQIGEIKFIEENENKTLSMKTISNEEIANQIKSSGTNLYVEILNGMEYASSVEYGHTTRSGSWVRGHYMLTISLDEIEREMNPRFQKAFHEWAKKKGLGT